MAWQRLKRLALDQARQVAQHAHGMAHEEALERRETVDRTQPKIAHQAQRRQVVGEQPIQRIGRNLQGDDVEAPPGLIARQNVRRTDVEP